MYDRNTLSRDDKKFIEALLGDLTTGLGVFHRETRFIGIQRQGMRGFDFGKKFLVPTFEELYRGADDQPYNENICFKPAPCINDPDVTLVAEQRCIWSNLRYKDKLHDDDLEERLGSLPCPPSAVVDTGDGLDAYWLLSEGLTEFDERCRAELTARYLSTSLLHISPGFGSPYDFLLHNKSHTNVPGTINYEVSGFPSVKLKYFDPNFCYSLENLSIMAWKLAREHWPHADYELEISEGYET